MMPPLAPRFAASAIAALVPLFLLWWMAADGIATTLRPAVSQVVRSLMPIEAVLPDGHKGWRVETGLVVTEGKASGRLEIATFDVDRHMLRRLSLSWPLLFALMLAPPRAAGLAPRLAAALAILATLFVAGACVELFCRVAMLVNHQRIFENDVLPTVRVAAPAYSDAAFFGGQLGLSAALFFQPFVVPPVLWLALNPRARSVLFQAALDDGLRARPDIAGVRSARPRPGKQRSKARRE